MVQQQDPPRVETAAVQKRVRPSDKVTKHKPATIKNEDLGHPPKVLVKDPSQTSGKAPSPDHGLTRQTANERGGGGLKKSGASANLRKDDEEVMQESGENKSNGEPAEFSSSPAQNKMILKESSEDDGEPYIHDEDGKDQMQTFDMNQQDEDDKVTDEQLVQLIQ